MTSFYKVVLVSILSFSVAVSCSTFDAYTGEKKTSKTAKGAGIGAGVAAVAAYLATKDESDSRTRNEKILKAAAGGAAIGGGIGYYMDRQEAKLREQLRGTGVSIHRDGDNINLIMPGNITFPSGSADLNTSFHPVLDSVAIVLEEYNRTLVVISGHTDNTGSDITNQLLSNNRAASVADYLMSKGLLTERIEKIGFGPAKPIASNDTAEGREQNRRVEIALIPIEAE